MEREEVLRRHCLATTFMDYRCRNCLKCLRNPHLSVTENVENFTIREDGVYDHIRDYAWRYESISFELFRLRSDLNQFKKIVFSYGVSPTKGIFCWCKPVLSSVQNNDVSESNIEDKPEERSDNGELLGGKDNVIQFYRLDHAIVEAIGDAIKENVEMLNRATRRIHDLKKELHAHSLRKDERLKRLRRRSVLHDLVARQHGCPMRDIDMITMVDSVIPNGFNMSQFRINHF